MKENVACDVRKVLKQTQAESIDDPHNNSHVIIAENRDIDNVDVQILNLAKEC